MAGLNLGRAQARQGLAAGGVPADATVTSSATRTPSQTAPVGSAAYLPPPMITTQPTGAGASEQGPVYSWNFPTVSATPTVVGSKPAGKGGGSGSGGGGANPNAYLNQVRSKLGLPPLPGSTTPGAPVPGGLGMGGLQLWGPGGGGKNRAAGGGAGGQAYEGPGELYEERSVMRRSQHMLDRSGLIHSAVPGRTDKIKASVPAGAYIVPADVVSGLGEGNTMAGASVIDKMIHSQPHGIRPPEMGRGRRMGPPAPPGGSPAGPAGMRTVTRFKTPGLAGGGEVMGQTSLTMPPMPEPVAPGLIPGGVAPKLATVPNGETSEHSEQNPPLTGQKPSPGQPGNPVSMKRGGGGDGRCEIIVAGGEYHIHPDDVARFGGGDLTAGHDKLDKWVIEQRKKNVEKTAKLPGPKK